MKDKDSRNNKGKNNQNRNKHMVKKIEKLVRNNDVKGATNLILSNGLCSMNKDIQCTTY